MNTSLLKYARQLFKSYNASPDVIRSYQLKWARSVHNLGDKWLFAVQVERK